MLLSVTAAAQVTTEAVDTLTARPEPLPPTTRVVLPVKATMMAAAFPGLGQVYNRKYWKIPLVYAGFGALGYSIVWNSQNFNGYMTAYQDLTDDITETTGYEKYTGAFDSGEIDPALGAENYSAQTHATVKNQLLNGVSYYRRYRDLSYIGVGLWYIISILDANVDALMSDYDISPELRMSIEPVPVPTVYGSTVGVGVTLTF